MPRLARIAPKEYVYHILTRGNNRDDIFKDDEDHEKYIELLGKYKKRYEFMLYHYVLITNHMHLVLEPLERGGNLAEIMKGINLSYAQHYKRRYRHVGHFWQDRYKSIIVSKDDYLLACGSYVELNPVRARIVEDPKHYRWSSYNAYAYGKVDPITDKHPIYNKLSSEENERRRNYREFVKGMLREKDALKGIMRKRTVYGDDAFVKTMGARYKMNAVIRPTGRPRKIDNERN
jgi:putative transposase